jgi:hypothetical protein
LVGHDLAWIKRFVLRAHHCVEQGHSPTLPSSSNRRSL